MDRAAPSSSQEHKGDASRKSKLKRFTDLFEAKDRDREHEDEDFQIILPGSETICRRIFIRAYLNQEQLLQNEKPKPGYSKRVIQTIREELCNELVPLLTPERIRVVTRYIMLQPLFVWSLKNVLANKIEVFKWLFEFIDSHQTKQEYLAFLNSNYLGSIHIERARTGSLKLHSLKVSDQPPTGTADRSPNLNKSHKKSKNPTPIASPASSPRKPNRHKLDLETAGLEDSLFTVHIKHLNNSKDDLVFTKPDAHQKISTSSSKKVSRSRTDSQIRTENEIRHKSPSRGESPEPGDKSKGKRTRKKVSLSDSSNVPPPIIDLPKAPSSENIKKLGGSGKANEAPSVTFDTFDKNEGGNTQRERDSPVSSSPPSRNTSFVRQSTTQDPLNSGTSSPVSASPSNPRRLVAEMNPKDTKDSPTSGSRKGKQPQEDAPREEGGGSTVTKTPSSGLKPPDRKTMSNPDPPTRSLEDSDAQEEDTKDKNESPDDKRKRRASMKIDAAIRESVRSATRITKPKSRGTSRSPQPKRHHLGGSKESLALPPPKVQRDDENDKKTKPASSSEREEDNSGSSKKRRTGKSPGNLKKATSFTTPVVYTLMDRKITEFSWEVIYEEISFKEKIGKGGFGVVNRAVFRDQDVAVKQLRKDVEDSMTQIATESFLKEIAILSQTSHINILSFIGASLGRICLITEFCPNGDLISFLHSNPIVWTLQLKFMKDVANGMKYLHGLQHPIVHRDLKGSNVLVDKNLTLKLSDFGLGRHFIHGETRGSSGNVGTVNWCAPEILFNEEPFSTSADVYSFGMVCYEIMTNGEMPYSDLGPLQTLRAIEQGELPILPQMEPSTASLINACWEEKNRRPHFPLIVSTLDKVDYNWGNKNQNTNQQQNTTKPNQQASPSVTNRHKIDT